MSFYGDLSSSSGIECPKLTESNLSGNSKTEISVDEGRRHSRLSQNFNNTEVRRTKYLRTVVSIVTEILLPIVSIISSILNTLNLIFNKSQQEASMGVALILLPNVLFVCYYLENMFHREKKILELFLLITFGPIVRWLCSVKLLMIQLSGDETAVGDEDILDFINASKLVDGIIQTAVQVIWILYLIAIDIYPFLPFFLEIERKQLNWFGNQVDVPVISSLTLYSSLAVLVKNLADLWMLHIPRATNQAGSETVLDNQGVGKLKKLQQWMLLILFVTSGVLYRLVSYLLLFVHLNLFMMPSLGVMILSFALHIVLRGLSNQFYVDATKMDVFLTACCCSLVPTPTSPDIKAHNLLQAHCAITNLLLMFCLGTCMFLSIDYSLPIINRPLALRYDSYYFQNYCIFCILLMPVSLLFYGMFKKALGNDPLAIRKTLFWNNRKPTAVGVLTGISTSVVFFVLISIHILGRISSSYCDLRPDLVQDIHGEVRPLPTGIGVSVECHERYVAHPAATIYCSHFFDTEGEGGSSNIQVKPYYYESITNPHEHDSHGTSHTQNSRLHLDRTYKFVRALNYSDIYCTKMKDYEDCLDHREDKCNATLLPHTPVRNGKWICQGTECILQCEVIFGNIGNIGFTFICLCFRLDMSVQDCQLLVQMNLHIPIRCVHPLTSVMEYIEVILLPTAVLYLIKSPW